MEETLELVHGQVADQSHEEGQEGQMLLDVHVVVLYGDSDSLKDLKEFISDVGLVLEQRFSEGLGAVELWDEGREDGVLGQDEVDDLLIT